MTCRGRQGQRDTSLSRSAACSPTCCFSSWASSTSLLPLRLGPSRRFLSTPFPHATEKEERIRKERKRDRPGTRGVKAMRVVEWYRKQKENGVLSACDIPVLAHRLRQKTPLHSPSSSPFPLPSPLQQIGCVSLGVGEPEFSGLLNARFSPSLEKRALLNRAAECSRDVFFSLTVKEKEELAIFFLFHLGKVPEGLCPNIIFDALLDAPTIDVIPRFLQQTLFADPSLLRNVHPKYLARCFELGLPPLSSYERDAHTVGSVSHCSISEQERQKRWISWGELYVSSPHHRCSILRKVGLWYEVLAYENYHPSYSTSPLSFRSEKEMINHNGEEKDDNNNNDDEDGLKEEYLENPKRHFHRNLLSSPLGWGRCPIIRGGSTNEELPHILSGGFGMDIMPLLSHPELISEESLCRVLCDMPPIILDFSLHLLLLSWGRRTRLTSSPVVHRHTSMTTSLPESDALPLHKRVGDRSGEKGWEAGDGLATVHPTPALQLAHPLEDGSTAASHGCSEEFRSFRPPSPHFSSLPQWLVKHGYFTHQELLQTVHFDLQEGSSWTSLLLLPHCCQRNSISVLMQQARNPGINACWQALLCWLQHFPTDTAYLVLDLSFDCATSWPGVNGSCTARRTRNWGRKKILNGRVSRAITIQVHRSIQTCPDDKGERVVPTLPSSSLEASSPALGGFFSSPRESYHWKGSTPTIPTPPTIASAVSTAAAAAAAAVTACIPPPAAKQLMWAVESKRVGAGWTKGFEKEKKNIASILRAMPSLTSETVTWFLSSLLQNERIPPPLSSSSSSLKESQCSLEEGAYAPFWEIEKEGGKYFFPTTYGNQGSPTTVDVDEVLEALSIAVERGVALPNKEILVEVLFSLARCAEPSSLSLHHSNAKYSRPASHEFYASERMKSERVKGRTRENESNAEKVKRMTWEALISGSTGSNGMNTTSDTTSSFSSPLARVAEFYQQHVLPQEADDIFRMAIDRAWRVYEDEVEGRWRRRREEGKHEKKEKVQEESDDAHGNDDLIKMECSPMSSSRFSVFYSSSSAVVLGRLIHVSIQCLFFSGPAAFLSSLSHSSFAFFSPDESHASPPLSPHFHTHPSARQHRAPSAIYCVWHHVVQYMLLHGLSLPLPEWASWSSTWAVPHTYFHSPPTPSFSYYSIQGMEKGMREEAEKQEEEGKRQSSHSSSALSMSISSAQSLLEMLWVLSPLVDEGKVKAYHTEEGRKHTEPHFGVEMEVFMYNPAGVSSSFTRVKEVKNGGDGLGCRGGSDVSSSPSSYPCCWRFSSHNPSPHLPLTAPSFLPQLPEVSRSSLPFSREASSHFISSSVSSTYPMRVKRSRSVRRQYMEDFAMMQSVAHYLYRHQNFILWPLALHEVRHLYQQWVEYRNTFLEEAKEKEKRHGQEENRKDSTDFIRGGWRELNERGIHNWDRAAFLMFSMRLTREIHKAVRLACVGLGYEANPSSHADWKEKNKADQERDMDGDFSTPLPVSLRTILSTAQEWLVDLQTFSTSMFFRGNASSHLSLRLRQGQDRMLMWTVYTAADVLRQREYYDEAVKWLLPAVKNLPYCLQRLRCKCLEEIQKRKDNPECPMNNPRRGKQRNDCNKNDEMSHTGGTRRLMVEPLNPSRKTDGRKPQVISLPIQWKDIASVQHNKGMDRAYRKHGEPRQQERVGEKKKKAHDVFVTRVDDQQRMKRQRRGTFSQVVEIPGRGKKHLRRTRRESVGPRQLLTLLSQLNGSPLK